MRRVAGHWKNVGSATPGNCKMRPGPRLVVGFSSCWLGREKRSDSVEDMKKKNNKGNATGAPFFGSTILFKDQASNDDDSDDNNDTNTNKNDDEAAQGKTSSRLVVRKGKKRSESWKRVGRVEKMGNAEGGRVHLYLFIHSRLPRKGPPLWERYLNIIQWK